jgi:hypothetical protein
MRSVPDMAPFLEHPHPVPDVLRFPPFPVRRDMAAKTKGFKNNQAKIAKKKGISSDRAGAILASATRKASPAAKKKNPKLKKVK